MFKKLFLALFLTVFTAFSTMADCGTGYNIGRTINLADVIGTGDLSNQVSPNFGDFYVYVDNDGNFSGPNSTTKETYGITEKNTFVDDLGEKGFLSGRGRCSTQAGTNGYNTNNPTRIDSLTDQTGQYAARYCYCQLAGYGQEADVKLWENSYSPWFFDMDLVSASDCAELCAYSCGDHLFYQQGFRTAIFNAIDPIGICELQTYTITYNLNGGTNNANNPTSYTLKSANIILQSPTRKDYVFAGWCTDAELTNCETNPTISSGSTGDKTFYAKWTCAVGYHIKTIETAGTANPDLSGMLNISDAVSYNFANSGFVLNFETNEILTGEYLYSSQVGDNNNRTWSNPTTYDSLTNEPSAPYCYCRLTSYTSAAGVTQNITSPWVYVSQDGNYNECEPACQHTAANNSAYRNALIGVVNSSGTSCAPNQITINWSDVAEGESTTTVEYDGDIITPIKAVEKPGYIFKGWKFSKPE